MALYVLSYHYCYNLFEETFATEVNVCHFHFAVLGFSHR